MSLILVTGYRGYIGSRLLPELERQGHRVMTFIGDVTQWQDWTSNIAGEVPTAIVHLAAMNSLKDCEKDAERSFTTNYLSAIHAARMARSLGARLVFTTSTTAGLFDTIYEMDRYSAGQVIRGMRGLSYAILNLATVYGDSPTQAGADRGIINYWINAGLHGEAIRVYREVAAKSRHFVYVGDVVSYIIKVIEGNTLIGTYDLWSSERKMMLEAATEIGNALNAPVLLTNAPALYPVELRDEKLTVPLLMYQNKWVSFAEGMRLTIEAMRNA